MEVPLLTKPMSMIVAIPQHAFKEKVLTEEQKKLKAQNKAIKELRERLKGVMKNNLKKKLVKDAKKSDLQ